MTTITSPHNPHLKRLRRLHRARERAHSGLFAAEGEDLVRAARAFGRLAVEGFRTPGVDVGEEGFHEVEPAALASASVLGSGTRAIGVYEQRWGAPAGPLCVYLHGVSDPGNVGTVLRGALAFGASCVALGPDCADPHSPKAVRASMGAIFAVALARVHDVSELPGERVALVAGAGEPLWGLCEVVSHEGPRARTYAGARTRAHGTPNRSNPPNPAKPSDQPAVVAHVEPSGERRPALTLLVGAEREGLPEGVVAACEHIAHIPIASESLNAAMAATVALYEMTRPSTRVPES